MRKYYLQTFTFTVLLTLLSAGSLNAAGLNDVKEHWANENIEHAVSTGYVVGYEDGSFKPNQNVSRAEFLAMLSKALKIPTVSSKVDSQWYDPYVNSLTDLGIHNPENFDDEWNKAISRMEISRLAVRASDPAAASSIKADKDFIYQAVSKGIIQGLNGGNIEKEGVTTRAQAVTVIERILKITHGEQLEVDEKALNKAKEE